MNNLSKIFSKHFSTPLLPTEPIWDFRYFERATHIRFHVPNTGNRDHIALGERDIYQSQGIYSFTSKDFTTPIDELLMVRFPGQFVSLVAYARPGVIQQLVTATKHADVGELRVIHKHLGDHRKRLALTIEAQLPDEVSRMQRWIRCLDKISPFTTSMQSILNTVLTAEDKVVESELKFKVSDVTKEGRPLYLSFPDHIYYMGESARFNPLKDKVIAQKCPPIIDAILESRADKVKALLESDPSTVMNCDPWGYEPTELARDTGQEDIFEMLVEKRKDFIYRGCPAQHNYQQSIRSKEARKSRAEQESNKRVTEDPLEKAKANYKKLKQEPIPKRTRLQDACIQGDLATVQFEVLNGASLNECDVYGFKPLFLAVANDHYDIAKWLLEQGASIETYHEGHPFRGYRGFVLVDQVKSPEMMRLVLFYHAGIDGALRRLMEFLEDNNHKMVEVLLYYLRDINTKKMGLTPFHYAIEHTKGETQRRLVELFSQYWEDYLPKGPYDESLSPEIQELLTKHNQRIKKRELSAQSRPRIQEVIKEPGQIRTVLSVQNDEPIVLVSKRASMLTHSEIATIKKLFNETFSMYENDTVEHREEYFSHYIDHPHDEAYVDVCRHKGRVISFLFYEFFDANTPSRGAFRVFHAQLGATEKTYQDMGLANLAFRAAITTWSPEDAIFIFGKCISPGLAFPLFPKSFNGLPSHKVPQDIIGHVLGLVDAKLNADKSITPFLKLNANKNPQSYKLNRFRFFMGSSSESAAPVAFFLDEDTIGQYLSQMKSNGVTEDNLEAFQQNWPPVGVACKM